MPDIGHGSDAQDTSGSELNQKEGFLRRCLWLVGAMLGLPLLYVLSLGPAIYVLPVSITKPLYGPLIRFEQRCPPLDRFQTWYMEKVWRCKMW